MEHLKEKTLKGYELLERIGAGGFGAVYKAYQSTIGREVAIKFILPGFANHPDFIRRFETEAHVIARLEHPYIVPLYDYWRDPEGAYLVMRWLRGGSLREKLKGDGALTVDEAHTMLSHICSGLELAHRHDVIHRDIKPGNILLDEDGNAYLADFGIAKDFNNYDTNRTGLDEIVGSLDYLSPEQARSEAVSPATDIYSLGVMLFEMLAGQHPFYGASTVKLLYKHINDPLPELSVLDLTIRDAVNEVIQKATQKNPADRYQDALSFAGDFREAIHATDHLASSLTQREYDVLHRIVDGLSNQQIADELFIALSTVKTYVNQIYKKLGVRSRVQAQLRAHELNLLEAGVGQEIPSLTSSYLPEPENPYKGLQAFEAHDSRDFFGREQLIEKLIKKMQDGHDNERFLAVIGPSGSGKSSLVKAGLIPAIWNGNIPGSDRWFTLDMIPGDHPMEELEVALTRISANPVADLNEHLRRDERGLLRASKLILPADNTRLLIVIDQFEELFTHVDSEEERQHFLDVLYTAITDSRSRIRIIITLRADFYDRPLHYPDFGDLVRSRMETILPLSAKELQSAIQKPAGRVLVTFEEGLVAQIVSDVNYQSGALPLLQYALTELFEERQGRLLTQEAYQAIGGVIGALTQRAENLFAELNEDTQKITRLMFLRLVTPGEGTGDTRRRVPRSELLAISENPELMNDLIDLFAEHRMLSLDHDLVSRSPTVEVAHESILGQWERLRTWINQNREEIKMQQQISRMAEEWEHAGRDSGYLARGLRLNHMLDWAEHSKLPLTDKEQQFLDASLYDRQQRKQLEEARKEREIDLEQRSIRNLRALVITFIIASVVSTLFAIVAYTQRKTAEDARATSEAFAKNVQNQATEIRSLLLTNQAQDAGQSGDMFLALALAAEAVRVNDTIRENNQALGEFAQQSAAIHRFEGHRRRVTDVAFSSDGQSIISASADETLILWDTTTGDIIQHFEGHTDQVMHVAFSPDGQSIISASTDETLILWDIATGDIIRRFEGHTGNVRSVAFSPDGQTILSGACTEPGTSCSAGEVILWNTLSGNILARITAHDGNIHTVAFSMDGQQALSASDHKVIIWNVSADNLMQVSEIHEPDTDFETLTFNLNAQFVIATMSDGTTRRYADDGTWQAILEFEGRVFASAFRSDFQQMVFSTQLHQLVLLDTTGQELQRLNGHEAVVTTLAFSPDGQTLLTGDNNGILFLWGVSNVPGQAFTGHENQILSIAVSPDGQSVLAGGGHWGGGANAHSGNSNTDHSLILWDVASGEILHRFEGHSDNVWDVAFSPDGQQALSASADGTIILWDVNSGQILQQLEGHEGTAESVTFSQDVQQAISGSNDFSVILWDLSTASPVRRYEGHQGSVLDVAFSPDETMIVSAGGPDRSAILWDVETGDIIHRLQGHQNWVDGIAFSPDGQSVMTASSDGLMILWDVETGEIIRHFEGHTGFVMKVDFSSDGQQVLSASTDGSARLWDVATATAIHQFDHPGRVHHIAFSPDNRGAFTAAQDGIVRLWHLPGGDLLQWVEENRYIRDFTCEEREEYRIEPYCIDDE